MNGILLINKEINMTSRDVVNCVSRILHTKKVGHTGTLDPLATGVMVVCIGSATKLVEIITSHEKEYIAEVVFGMQTDTGDTTGNIIYEEDTHLSLEEIKQACIHMCHTYMQTVPIYSAVKINGKKLYEYARKGESITLPKREVTIYSLEVISNPIYENGKTKIKIKTLVSKGTYIRSLIEDLAAQLHTIGTMSALERIKQGNYKIEDCVTLSDLKNGNFQIHDLSAVLNAFPKVIANDFLKKKIENGSLLENRYENDVILFETEDGHPLALYQVYSKDPTKIKPWKML